MDGDKKGINPVIGHGAVGSATSDKDSESIAVAKVDHTVGRITAAQAADELLNISGIDTSFVLFPDQEGRVILSARSMGDVNVQVVLEKLGGGGNAATAGAQVPGKGVDEVNDMLLQAIDAYLEEE